MEDVRPPHTVRRTRPHTVQRHDLRQTRILFARFLLPPLISFKTLLSIISSFVYKTSPAKTAFANAVYPTSFGWHGSQLCASHWKIQAGSCAEATHLLSQSWAKDFCAPNPHSRFADPPKAENTSMVGCGSLFAALIFGMSAGKKSLIIVWFMPEMHAHQYTQFIIDVLVVISWARQSRAHPAKLS